MSIRVRRTQFLLEPRQSFMSWASLIATTPGFFVSSSPCRTILHAPVHPTQPPRRPRSDVADNRVIVDSPNGGGIVPPSGGGRRRREGDPRPGNGGADSPAAREGNGLLSEDSFYRVAVEKIIERERLGAEISDEHGDGRVSGGSGGGGKSGGSRNSSKRRTQDEARKGVVDPTVFASPRGAAPDRPARRKVKIMCDAQLAFGKTCLKRSSLSERHKHARGSPYIRSFLERCRRRSCQIELFSCTP